MDRILRPVGQGHYKAEVLGQFGGASEVAMPFLVDQAQERPVRGVNLQAARTVLENERILLSGVSICRPKPPGQEKHRGQCDATIADAV